MSDEAGFLRHIPCEACGSSDAGALYTDGHTYCHKCNAYTKATGDTVVQQERKPAAGMIQEITYQALTKRCLNEETCKHWGYGVAEYNGKHVQVANYRDNSGQVIAQKVRFPNKDFVMLGDMKKAGLYGQHLSRVGGKMVVVVEGEIDALSVSQVQNLKYSVVSVPNGAQGAKKALQRELEWLEKFESVILMLDNDEEGIKATKQCIELFTPGKCKVARLPLKDANEMLQAGRGHEVIDAIWSAKPERPDGIINGNELWDVVTAEDVTESRPYPWAKLNELTHGMRKGEIVTLVAGTGVGKSSAAMEICHHLHKGYADEVLGLIALEQGKKQTGRLMMGLELNKRIIFDEVRAGVPKEELKGAFDSTIGSGRVFLYDHWGSTDSDNLINKIRYLVKGCGCSTILLDHLSIVVSGIADGDERRIIDNTMTKLRSMVEEVKCRLLLINHLRRPEGKAHEDGAQVSLSHLRGSTSIGQLSDIILALERNQQDREHGNRVMIRCLKNRFTGETGEGPWLEYQTETGRYVEVAPPVFDDEGDAQPTEENKDF